MQIETYLLPAHWASALINADTTGLEGEEEEELNHWLTTTAPGCCIGCTDSPSFTTWHDARPHVLACDCLEYTFQVIH